MKFLSIKDALQKYEVTQTTLTRFARTHQKTKNVKKENRKYFILDSFLASHFQTMDSHLDSLTIQTSNQSEPKKESSKELEIVTILKSQNEFLQNQIIEKDSQINKLLQRQSEQNIIIQTLQNRFEVLQNGIDNGVKMLSESMKENKEVPPGRNDKQNDNSNYGYTLASSVMIILLVIMIVIYLTVK